MGRRYKQVTHWGKKYKWRIAYEDRHLINNQENANQNHSETALFDNQMGRIKKTDKI